MLNPNLPSISQQNWLLIYIWIYLICQFSENHLLGLIIEITSLFIFGDLIFDKKILPKLTAYHFEGLIIVVFASSFQLFSIFLSVLSLFSMIWFLSCSHFSEKWKNYPLVGIKAFEIFEMQVELEKKCSKCDEKQFNFQEKDGRQLLCVCAECAMKILEKIEICECCHEKCL